MSPAIRQSNEVDNTLGNPISNNVADNENLPVMRHLVGQGPLGLDMLKTTKKDEEKGAQHGQHQITHNPSHNCKWPTAHPTPGEDRLDALQCGGGIGMQVIRGHMWVLPKLTGGLKRNANAHVLGNTKLDK
jgi:hypothetical protein